MSDKEDDIDLNDDWFDDNDSLDFDFDEFDENTKPIDTSRRGAILSVGKSTGKGLVKGLANKDRRKKLILDSLPSEYKVAADTASDVLGQADKIYNSAREEAVMTAQALKRNARQLMPQLRRFMPESIAERADKLLAEDDLSSGYHYNDTDPTETAINVSNREIFGDEKTDISEPQTQEGYTRKALRTAVKDIEDDRVNRLIAGMRHDISDLSSYNRTIGTAYRRKMIELGYRQLGALETLVKITGESNERTVPAIEGILKNTGLPDYAKEEMGEVVKAKFKRRIIDNFGPDDYRRSFLKNVGNNALGEIKEFASGIRQAIDLGSMMANDMLEDDADLFGPTLSPAEQRIKDAQTSGAKAGEWAANKYINPQIDKLTAKIRAKLDLVPGIKNKGYDLKYLAENLPYIANSMRNGFGDYDGEYKQLAKVVDQFRDIIPGFGGEQLEATVLSSNDRDEPVPWRAESDKTLNVIIPAALAKIDQSIRTLTYGRQQPLETYDHETNGFVTTEEITNRIRDRISPYEDKEWIRSEIDRVIDDIDKDEMLSDEERSAFGRYIDNVMRKGLDFNLRDMANGRSSGFNNRYFRGSDTVTSVLNGRDDLSELNSKISDRMKRMRSQFGYMADNIESIRSDYGDDALVRAGVYNKDGRYLVQNNRIFDSYEDFGKDQVDIPTYDKVITNQLLATGDAASVKFKGKSVNFRKMTEQGFREALYKGNENLYTVLAKISKSGQLTPKEQKASLQSLVEEIRDHLINSKVPPTVESINERVIEIAEKGITTYTFDSAEFAEELDKRFRAWVPNLNIKERGKRAKDFTVDKWKMAKDFLGPKFSSAKDWMVEKAGDLKDWWDYEKPYNSRKGFWHGLRNQIRGVWDIFDADGNLVLSAEKMKAGEYINEAGKVIKRITDIDGTIFNKDGTIAFTREQLAAKLDGLKYFAHGKWQAAWELFSTKLRNSANLTSTVATQAINFITRHAKKFYNERRVSGDIYVKGEESPRIRAIWMIKGLYITQSGKAIRDAFDIDGPVFMGKKCIISAEEMAEPGFELVDADGKPLKTINQRLADFSRARLDSALEYAKLPLQAAQRAYERIRDFAGSVKDGLHDWVDRKRQDWGFDKAGTEVQTRRVARSARDIVKRLDDIHELLDKRMPGGVTKPEAANDDSFVGPQKKAGEHAASGPDKKTYDRAEYGDVDNDNIRDGSWRDRFRKSSEKRKAKAAEQKEKNKAREKKENGFLSKLFSGLGLLMTPITKMAGWITGGGLVSGLLTAIGAGLKGMIGLGAKGLWKGAKSLVSGGWKLLKGIPALAGLGTAVSSAGSTALGYAATAGTTAAGWLATGAAAVGSVVMSPVGLAVGAVAAVGYMAYKAATKVHIKPTDQIRFAQYGTSDYNDGSTDDMGKLLFLENEIESSVKFDKYGMASIEGISRNVIIKMANGLGITDESSPQEFEEFRDWLVNRFAPVYLTWVTVAKKHAPGVKLSEISDYKKVTATTQITMIKEAHISDKSYIWKVTRGPLDQSMAGQAWRWVQSWGTDKPIGFLTDYNDVKELEDDVIEMLGHRAKHEAKHSAKAKGEVKRKSDLENTTTKTKFTFTKERAELAGSKNTNSFYDPKFKGDKKAKDSKDNVDLNSYFDPSDKKVHMLRDPSKLNLADSARIKAYGVSDYDIIRIQMLYMLEDQLLKHVTLSNGIPKLSKSVDITELMEQSFTDTSIEVRKQYFLMRFLPVFFYWVSSVKGINPQGNPFDYDLNKDAMKFVSIMKGLKSVTNKDTESIWRLSISPFKDFVLESDSKSIDFEIDELTSIAHENAAKAKVESARNGAVKEITPEEYKRRLDRLRLTKNKDKVEVDKVDKSNAKENKYNGFNWTNEQAANDSRLDRIVGRAASGAYGPAGEAGPTAPGMSNENGTPDYMRGFAGNRDASVDANSAYGKIRLNSSDPKDVARMIQLVAKATGMDENLLMTVCMMESSFNPSAGAKTSSAKGLFQFTNGTWKETIAKYGKKYGIPAGTSVMDPVANALLGAEYLRGGSKAVSQVIKGRHPSPVDLYLAHFMGHGGAKSFLRQLQKNPSVSAVKVFPDSARANKDIFYAKGGRPRSIGQVYNELSNRARQRMSEVAKYVGKPMDIVDLAKEMASTGEVDHSPNKPREEAEDLNQKLNDPNLAVDSHTGPLTPTPTRKPTSVDTTEPKVQEQSPTVVDNKGTDISEVRKTESKARKEIVDKQASEDISIRKSVQNNAETSENLTREIGKVLLDQLDVQKEILKTLVRIEGKVGGSAATANQSTSSQPTSTIKERRDEQQRNKALQAAIGMGRR